LVLLDYRYRWWKSTILRYTWRVYRVVTDGEVDVAMGHALTLRGVERAAADAINEHGRYVEQAELGQSGGAIVRQQCRLARGLRRISRVPSVRLMPEYGNAVRFLGARRGTLPDSSARGALCRLSVGERFEAAFDRAAASDHACSADVDSA
jgi:hypothetical protein